MKKTMLIICMAILICLSCVACSSRGICESCGQEEMLTQYNGHGRTYMVCEDCRRAMKLLGI